MVGYFGYRLGSVDQHAGSMAQPYFGKAVDKCITGPLLKKAAKCGVRHISKPRHFVEGYGFVEVVVHVLQRFFNTPAVISVLFGIVEKGV